MAVAVVLIMELVTPVVRLRRIVSGDLGIDRDEGGASLEVKGDVALQADRRREISPRGQEHGPAAGGRGRQNGPVDRV